MPNPESVSYALNGLRQQFRIRRPDLNESMPQLSTDTPKAFSTSSRHGVAAVVARDVTPVFMRPLVPPWRPGSANRPRNGSWHRPDRGVHHHHAVIQQRAVAFLNRIQFLQQRREQLHGLEVVLGNPGFVLAQLRIDRLLRRGGLVEAKRYRPRTKVEVRWADTLRLKTRVWSVASAMAPTAPSAGNSYLQVGPRGIGTISAEAEEPPGSRPSLRWWASEFRFHLQFGLTHGSEI